MLLKYRKQLFISLLIVFLFFFMLFFCSFIYYKKIKKPISIKVDYHTSKVIKIKNLLPTSDTLGKTFTGTGTVDGVQGYVEFTIKNNSNKMATYEVYIKEQENTPNIRKIRGDYIKFYLTNKSDAPYSGYEKDKLPTFNELPIIVDKPDGKLLYRGKLGGEKSADFKVRVWLSDSYSMSNLKKEKEFTAQVNVRSI